jgi:hypothetical protein
VDVVGDQRELVLGDGEEGRPGRVGIRLPILGLLAGRSRCRGAVDDGDRLVGDGRLCGLHGHRRRRLEHLEEERD